MRYTEFTTEEEHMINIGIIGYGYWGPNIVRNFSTIEGARVRSVCDSSPTSLNRAKKSYPQITTTNNCSEILTSPEIDAVAVITPVSTHFDLAKKALEN